MVQTKVTNAMINENFSRIERSESSQEAGAAGEYCTYSRCTTYVYVTSTKRYDYQEYQARLA